MAIHIKLKDGNYFGITNEMTGKMSGMWSLNTSPSVNPFCLKMRKNPKYICKSCYTKSSEARWKETRAAWSHNSAVLSSRLLRDKEIPLLMAHKSAPEIFRFQAHGDLMNGTHYKNLLLIAEANPERMFALWTKNLPVIKRVGLRKLPNLIYIYSTPELDNLNPVKPQGFEKVFDKVFSVYSSKFIKLNNISINCQKYCYTCRICYSRNDTVFINEKIK